MPCINIERCPIPLDDGVGPIYKRRYCESNWESCARFAVFDRYGPPAVPSWLRPNMMPEAEDIILRQAQSEAESA